MDTLEWLQPEPCSQPPSQNPQVHRAPFESTYKNILYRQSIMINIMPIPLQSFCESLLCRRWTVLGISIPIMVATRIQAPKAGKCASWKTPGTGILFPVMVPCDFPNISRAYMIIQSKTRTVEIGETDVQLLEKIDSAPDCAEVL